METKLEVRCECLTEKEESVTEEKVCEMCGGTGEIQTYIMSEETGYNLVADDVRPCECQLKEEEFDNQD